MQLSLLKLRNAEEIFFLELVEDAVKLTWALEEKLVIVVILWDVNQMERHKLIKATLPLSISDAGSLILLSLILPILGPIATSLSSVCFFHETERGLNVLMDLLVVLEDNVILRLVLLDLLDPLATQLVSLDSDVVLPLLLKLIWDQTQKEVLVLVVLSQSILVSLNFSLHVQDLSVELLDVLFLGSLEGLLILEVFLFGLSLRVVTLNEKHQISCVLFKLSLGQEKSLITTLELGLKLFNFLTDCVISELGQEHLLLLIDEFVDVLSTLLLGELNTGARNVHGLVDCGMALLADADRALGLLTGWDVLVLNTYQWCSTGGSVLLPDLKILCHFLLLLALLLLSLPRNKDFFVIGRSERRDPVIGITEEHSVSLVLWTFDHICLC